MTETAENEAHPVRANIHTALAAAQAEMGRVTKGSTNPHFKSKYADLADLVSVARPALNAHGIAYWHEMGRDETGERTMGTVLCHGESGTMLRCDVPLIVQKNDMQGMKSATTYAKRIGFESVTGIAPEDDDDGNAAAAAAPKNGDAKLAQDMSQGLRQAWSDGIKDSLPEGASQHDLDRAYANAICAQFHKVKSLRGLHSNWDKRQDIIAEIRERHPEIAADIDDAYDRCERALNETTEGAAA